jgi:hypothetical protein
LAGFVCTLAAINNDATIPAKLRSAESILTPALNPNILSQIENNFAYMPIRRRKFTDNPLSFRRLKSRPNNAAFGTQKRRVYPYQGYHR